jgi:hypothetical protein
MARETPNPFVSPDAIGGIAGNNAQPIVIDAADVEVVYLPTKSFLTDATYQKVNGDLIATGPDGTRVVIRGYYDDPTPPELSSPDGSFVLSPQLLESFTLSQTPGQYAQAGPAAAPAQPIGIVAELKGTVFAVRADGTKVQLNQGDSVYQGDIIETGKDGAVKMLFVDKTTFALGDEARLALDELVFNPATQEGQSQFSILKGVFVFASGQIAKADHTKMTVVTPVATIGIRGTEASGNVGDDGLQVTVLDGTIEVTNSAGSTTLGSLGETTTVGGNKTAPTQTFTLTPQEYQQVYANVVNVSSGTNLSNTGSSGSTSGGSESEGGDGAAGGDGSGGQSSEGSGEGGGEQQSQDAGGEQQGQGEGGETGEGDGGQTSEEGGGDGEAGAGSGAGDGPGDTGNGQGGGTVGVGDPGNNNPPPGNNNGVNSPSFGGVGDGDLTSNDDLTDVGSNSENNASTGDNENSNNGNDTMIAGSGEGNDTYDGGAGSDLLEYPSVTSASLTFTINGLSSTSSVTDNGAGIIDDDKFINFDTVLSGGGDDTFSITTGSDPISTLDGSGGADTVDFSAIGTGGVIDLDDGDANFGSLFTLNNFENATGSGGDDTITGDGSANVLDGGGGGDRVNGGGGDDTILGSAGSDSLDGGADTDTLDYSAQSADLVGNLSTGTVTGLGTDTFSNFEIFKTGSGNDTVTDSSGNDTIDTGGGNDTVIASNGGNDVFIGGAGNDFLNFAGRSNDLDIDIDGSSNVGVAVVAPSTMTVDGFESITGGSGNDVFNVNSFADINLDGGTGTDHLNFASQTDGMTANSSAGSVSLSSSSSIVNYSNIDSITFGSGNDTFNDFGGNNVSSITFGDGNDRWAVFSSADGANAALNGGDGNDNLSYSSLNNDLNWTLTALRTR